ncbi:MAG: NPCBM/NEW2 domain-containing protein, partial [Anaerolineae bacterium]|nr:NPCBM/NEW2 domain-containing protein [Phycisphaerae bacterium]
ANLLYRGGDTIQYAALATDNEDGTLPASAYVWQVDLHHGTHSHPFLTPITGVSGGSFAIPTTGETSPDVYYRILLTVTDSSGLTYTTFRDVQPRKANITLNGNIPGLSLSLDGQPRVLPTTILGVAGMTRLLTAPAQQTINGTVYTFSSWSDGGAASHNIAFPQADTTYTATYSVSAPTYLSSLTPTSATNGWGPYEKDRSNGEQGATDGRTITLGGVTFAKGLGVHAASDIRFNMGGGYGRFQAQVGLDDEVGNSGSVIFRVFADGVKIFDSGVVTGTSATQSIDVDVTGKNILQLVVDPNGVNFDDHADWADAKLLAPGAPPPPPPPPPGGLFYPPVGYGTGTHAHGVTNGDFNGDGKLDLAVANAGDNTLSVLFGNGNGTFGPATNYPVGSEPKGAFAKDLNNDGKLDLITPNQGSATVSVLINNGNGTFAPAVSYGSPGGSHEAFAGDFNGDGRPDIAVVGWGSTQMRVLINSGTGTFPTGANYTVADAPHSVTGADLDGDGDLDLAIANYGSSVVAILRGNGNGTFGAATFINVGTAPHSLRAADLNGDGRIDIVTANEAGDNVSVLLNNGNATFAPRVDIAAGDGPRSVAIADVNNDGKLDILTANASSNYPNGDNASGKKIGVLLGNGNGTFATFTVYDTGHTPFSVSTGDFDGDGDLDVVSANWHSSNVAFLKNTTIDTAPPPPANVAPLANDDAAATQTGAGVLINVLSNDTDNDGTLVASSVAITTTPTNGTATVDPVTGRITYTPNAAFVGTDTFFYTVKDDDGATSNPAKVTITVTAAPPPPPPTTTVYLSDLTPTSATNGWGPFERDRSNGEQGATDGATVTLNGVTYAKGLGVHAASDILYALGGQYTRFDSVIGIDDESGNNGSVIFQVYVDNVLVYDSGAMTGASANKIVSLDLAGKNALRLVVNTNGAADWDHADWADAKLTKGTPVPDTQAPTAPTNLRTTSITTNSIALAWDASTDNVGVAGYEIYRNSVKVGTSTTTTYNDTNLAANTTYVYTIKAYDAVPNLSGFSTSISPKTLVQGSLVYLSDLNPISATNGWGSYERDRSNGEQGATDGGPIRLNGVTYTKGLGVHANSDIRYNLNGQYTTFQAAIGMDDEVGAAGSVIFRVYIDGVLIYDSGAMNGATATKLLNLNVTGATQLRLVVDSNGSDDSDHADWADAKVS